jgi:2-methylcitrate dehydratase
LQLVQMHRINVGDIAELRIGLARRDAASQTRDPSCARPRSRDTANHSVRYCVAAALVEGELTADQFEPEKLCSRKILDLVDRTAVYWDESQESHWPFANPSTITIRTTGGQEFSKTLVFPPGHSNNPLTDDVLEEKFRQLTRRVLGTEKVEKIITLTRQLQDLPDVRGLTGLLRAAVK